MASFHRGRRTALLCFLSALAMTLFVVLVCRSEIVEWLFPGSDPRRASVALRFEWDPNRLVRCLARPYLREDETWLDVHEFPMDPGAKAAPDGSFRTVSGVGSIDYSYGIPDFREIERYLEFRKRERAPIFGEPDPLAVSITFDRLVPWQMVVNTMDICKRLGITDLDLDGDD